VLSGRLGAPGSFHASKRPSYPSKRRRCPRSGEQFPTGDLVEVARLGYLASAEYPWEEEPDLALRIQRQMAAELHCFKSRRPTACRRRSSRPTVHGCELFREGGRHTIYWNPTNRKTTAVPRHSEIVGPTAGRICKDLGVPKPGA